jgi:predicted dinucleotide-utilizing enzyme
VIVQERPAFQAAQLSEFESVLGVSTEQVRAARVRAGSVPYGDMPLIVLTSSAEAEADSSRREKLALLSARGGHRVIAQSGHYVQLDRPQSVVEAIEEVLASARKTP